MFITSQERICLSKWELPWGRKIFRKSLWKHEQSLLVFKYKYQPCKNQNFNWGFRNQKSQCNCEFRRAFHFSVKQLFNFSYNITVAAQTWGLGLKQHLRAIMPTREIAFFFLQVCAACRKWNPFLLWICFQIFAVYYVFWYLLISIRFGFL